MNILVWIIFGALVGWIASIIAKTNKKQGAFLNIVVGIIGSILGGLVMNLFGFGGISGFNFYSFVVAVLGAVILISVAKSVAK